MQSIKYLSLFSGIGGFELGLQQTAQNYRTHPQTHAMQSGVPRPRHCTLPDRRLGRAHCVGFSEIDPLARHIYQHHFPHHPPLGDITKIRANTLPGFDLLCGGFPCQAFSYNGKRQGLSDPRGALFFDLVRIARIKQPRFLFLENVKGFLSDANGQTAWQCFSALHDVGYDCQWQVLNSKNFGVPQNRERVFIIGHRRDQPRPAVFPFFRQTQRPDQTNRPHLLDPEHPQTLRRLTPLEYERLQGFPDHWTQTVPQAHRYQCLANAVNPLIIEAIAQRLFG